MTQHTYEIAAAWYSHGILVERLFKEMGSEEATAMHAGVGIAGEAGEILDSLKKTWVYNKPLDRANVIEEIGDMLFYTRKLMDMMGVDLTEVLNANMVKLNKRYPSGKYSDAEAQARADKEGAK